MSKNKRQLTMLKNLIGADLFDDVVHIFAGEKIVFPKCPDHIEKEQRNISIIAEYDLGSGATIPDLMKKYNLSQSQIYKILGRTP